MSLNPNQTISPLSCGASLAPHTAFFNFLIAKSWILSCTLKIDIPLRGPVQESALSVE